MEHKQTEDIEEQMRRDLAPHTNQTKYESTVIQGKGFKDLSIMSDYLPVPKMQLRNLDNFLKAYLATLNLKSQLSEKVRAFCNSLNKAKVDKVRKFQFLYGDEGGKGTWVGLYFKKISEDKCYFCSNVISCAFTLVPDVLVIHEETSQRFGPIRSIDHSIYLVQRARGFSSKDLQEMLKFCSFVTGQKAISM